MNALLPCVCGYVKRGTDLVTEFLVVISFFPKVEVYIKLRPFDNFLSISIEFGLLDSAIECF